MIMKVQKYLLALAGLVTLSGTALAQDATWPVHDNGLNDVVQWWGHPDLASVRSYAS